MGQVLHTADFRFGGDTMLQKLKLRGSQQFDYLYLDNTFCRENEMFPSQAVAYEMMRSQIAQIRQADPETKFAIYCYNLGKEEVFANLSLDFKTKVTLLKDRWNKCEAIGFSE